ncbi:hypothetical protein [Candidatus Merdisoma sp. JLR.KK006]|uniref:hypothetical protein n=1 Tax=Candidatus Merdisoma sp. JLR.KK006 TaxID=3112626 RepID=UPI002FF2DF0D
MINELYQLSNAMEKAEIHAQSWHRKYKPIPNIRAKAPCIRISLHHGKVTGISEVDSELGAQLRKYGSNQGSYPCMNLVPLYRITDENVKKRISELLPEELDDSEIEMIRSWCSEDNWGAKFRNKYRISMESVPQELQTMLGTFRYKPLEILMEETFGFLKPELLHKELEDLLFHMLRHKENVALALLVLFHFGSSRKAAGDDTGSLSVVFESEELIHRGIPVVSVRFTEELNAALLNADAAEECITKDSITDAFGISFMPIEEPMPEVKLAGGFDVKLRTMFKEQYCQTRYGRIENASYPISPAMRKKLQAALNWLGSSEQRELTWINIGKNEILFAYPYEIPQGTGAISFIRMFKRQESKENSFETQAKRFILELKQVRKPGTDSHAENIRIFILRKIDKARTKIIYSRLTNAYELEQCSEEWAIGCGDNLPRFSFGSPKVPFPLEVADILNRIWKQDGTLASNKFEAYPKYYGMKLLMEQELSTQKDLHILVQGAAAIGAYLSRLSMENPQDPIWWKVKDMLALLGLLLYWENIRKEQYMEDYPYMYGQLLKAFDELHALYCIVERDGELPLQLAGGSVFQAASDAPVRTLNLLGQRMGPYLMWAKSYRTKEVEKKNKESWRAGWLLFLCEKIALKIHMHWKEEIRLTDAEKAQLFIGYLAAFPKKEQMEDIEPIIDKMEEESENE